jgi:tetratricopeptide (TPR) repeat protein
LKLDAPQGTAELHRKVGEYYTKLTTDLWTDESTYRDPQWQSYELERVYHQTSAAPRQQLAAALNGFVRVFAADRRVFARLYAETLAQVAGETENDALRKISDPLLAGMAALADEESEATRTMFTSLIDSGKLEPKWRAKALDWRGYLLSRAQQYQAALVDIDAALAIEPNTAEYRIDRAMALQALGRSEEAIADFTAVLTAEPENAGALFLRASIRQLTGRYAEALDDVVKFISLQPRNVPGRVLETELLQALGRVDEAIKRLDAALALMPTDANLHGARARLLSLQDRFEEALAALDRAIELAPGDYYLVSIRATLIARTGDVERADVYATELAAGAEEAAAKLASSLGGVSPNELESRARLSAMLNRLEAEDTLRAIRVLASGGPEAVRLLQADALALQARARLQRGDWEAALQKYDGALQLDPQRAALLRSRALVFLMQRRPEEALAELNRALELAPDDSQALALRARTFLILGRLDEALADTTRLTESFPHDFIGQSVHAVVLRARGDLTRAAETVATIADNAGEFLDQVARVEPIGPATQALSAQLGPGSAAEVKDIAELTARARQDREGAIREVRAEAIAARALALGSEGKHDDAIAAWDQVLNLEPPRAEWYAQRGDSLRILGRTEQAAADFERAIDLDEEVAWVHAVLGQVYRTLGRGDDALREMDRAIGIEPALHLARTTRGLWRLAAGRHEDAIDDFSTVLQAQPAFEQALAGRAQAYQALGDVDHAVGDLKRFCELAPDNYYMVAWLANLLQAAGDLVGAADRLRVVADHAETFLTQAAEVHRSLTPDLIGLISQSDLDSLSSLLALAERDREAVIRQLRADAAAVEAMALGSQGRNEDAIAAWNRAIQDGAPQASWLASRGRLAHLLDRQEEALVDLKQAVELEGDLAWVRMVLGQVYVALGRSAEALTEFDTALRLEPSLSEVNVERGYLYSSMGAFEKAAADLRVALEADPSSIRSRAGLAWALIMLGRYTEAIDHLDRAIAQTPDYPPSYLYRGRAFHLMRQTDHALADFQQAVKLVPEWSSAQCSLSEALLLSGRPVEALQAAEVAVAKDDTDDWCYFVRALAHGALGDEKQAQHDISTAIDLVERRFGEQTLAVEGQFNAALYYLTRRGEGDAETAETTFGKLMQQSPAGPLQIALRDVQTVNTVRPSDEASRIAHNLEGRLDALGVHNGARVGS